MFTPLSEELERLSRSMVWPIRALRLAPPEIRNARPAPLVNEEVEGSCGPGAPRRKPFWLLIPNHRGGRLAELRARSLGGDELDAGKRKAQLVVVRVDPEAVVRVLLVVDRVAELGQVPTRPTPVLP